MTTLTKNQIYKLVDYVFGTPGKLISQNKSDPEIIYNANMIVEDFGKVWYGDIHKISDNSRLQLLADKMKKSVFILSEMDGRFENEDCPKLELAIIKITPQEKITINVTQDRST